MRICFYCGPTDRELRPYGPDGALLCIPCMQATPEREEAAKAVYAGKLRAAFAESPFVVVDENGPRAVSLAEAAALMAERN